MTDFNSSFLDHLRNSEKEREREFMKVSGLKKKSFVYPGEKLLRKYKQKIWHKRPHRKKAQIEVKKDLMKNNRCRSRYSWPVGNTPKSIMNKRHSFDSAILPEVSHCKDFPISEIVTELSGNRNNGNSPFSSSNSCGSPPDSQLLCKVDKLVVTSGRNYNSVCQKCLLPNSEQNNNTDLRCRCTAENCDQDDETEEKPRTQTLMESDKSEEMTYSENEDVSDKCSVKMDYAESENKPSENNTESEEIPSNMVSMIESERFSMSENDTTGETFIDVESLDDSGEVKMNEGTSLRSDKVTEVSENGVSDEPVQYVGSKVKHSQPSTQIAPVKWQQQFMSFLSSATASEEDDRKSHHSPRRKRSRKVRQSMCPCCVGSGGHHKKSEDGVKHRKQHSMIRDHRRFIRDMTQLVSLRNKVMAVCKILFPQCVSEVFNFANPDSEDVDKCIDQMISILHNAHQQFLQNLNSKSEISRSANSRKKFKSEKQGNLKYDQINSNEYLVSICDPSKPIGYPSAEKEADKQVTSEEPPPILFCSQADELNGSLDEKQPALFSNLCLPSDEGIVYAIPFENGIAFPDKTQVLLPGDDTSYNNLYPTLNGKVNNEENGKDHGRILSEADSGIVNDHDMSSQEDADKSVLFRNSSSLWNDVNHQSKTSPDSAKTEQTTNIFDLFLNYEPTCTKSEEKPDKNVSNSSHEEKKSEIKTPVKTGDRNIFESLINMNIEASVSLPKPVQHDERLDQICDKEIESFYFPLNKPNLDNLEDMSSTAAPKEIFVEVYDPAIRLCKKPKICLRAFKEKISVLVRWLLPEIAFEKNFLRNPDNLEYVLDAVILSNQKDTREL